MEKYSELSHKQTLIYEFICEYLDENGISPTIEDVKIGCNISSKSVVSYNLDILENTSKINDNWDNIDWGKPKKKEVKPETRDIKDIYLNDRTL